MTRLSRVLAVLSCLPVLCGAAGLRVAASHAALLGGPLETALESYFPTAERGERRRAMTGVANATRTVDASETLSQTGSGSAHDSFGPGGCARLSLSEAGTCVIRTECPDSANLAETDFSFLCVRDGVSALHSYGKGGFDKSEIFDTGVECLKCSSRGAVQSYGPGGCISTFQSHTGTCVVQTKDCEASKVGSLAIRFTCSDPAAGTRLVQLAAGALGTTAAVDSRVACGSCEAPPESATGGESWHAPPESAHSAIQSVAAAATPTGTVHTVDDPPPLADQAAVAPATVAQDPPPPVVSASQAGSQLAAPASKTQSREENLEEELREMRAEMTSLRGEVAQLRSAAKVRDEVKSLHEEVAGLRPNKELVRDLASLREEVSELKVDKSRSKATDDPLMQAVSSLKQAASQGRSAAWPASAPVVTAEPGAGAVSSQALKGALHKPRAQNMLISLLSKAAHLEG